MAFSSTTTFSFAFKLSPRIARFSTTSLRTTPTIVRLSQFTKKSSLNLSSSHTISGFSPILPRLNFPTPTPPSLTVVSAKGYKMKTHKASAKRFRVTGSGKIMRRRAGKRHLLRKKNTKRKLRLTALDCGYKLDSSFQPSQPSPTSVSPLANTKAYVASTSNSGSQQSDSNWFLHSGATSHMTNDLSNLSFCQPYQGHDQVAIGDGTTLPIAHTGNGLLLTPFPFHLTNMLRVPTLSSNLLSVHQLAVHNNCTITFDEDSFLVQD